MAEVGAITSIIGIVGAGAKLSLLLLDFASSIGSAGAEVRSIGTEISLFCCVLKQLERTLTQAKNRCYSTSAIETTRDILDRCRVIFKDLQIIFEEIQGNKAHSSETSIDFLRRIKWTMKRSKVQMHRATLESCKITLHIMLTTLEFAQKVSERKVSTIETELEDEQEEIIAQTLIIAQESANDRVLQLESDYGDREDLDNENPHTPKTTHNIAIQNYSYPTPILVQSPKKFEGALAVFDVGRTALSQRKVSSWLDDLVSETDFKLNAQSERFSVFSASTSNSSSSSSQLSYLLSRWTDQGERWARMREVNSKNEITSPSITEAIEDTHPQMDIRAEDPTVQETARSGAQDSSVGPLLDHRRRSCPPTALSLSKTSLFSPPISPTSSEMTTSDTLTIVPTSRNLVIRPLTPPITPTTPPSAKIRETFPSLAVETFKYLGISKGDSTKKILRSALQVYNLEGGWRSLMLYVVFNGGERRLGLDEKPKAVYDHLCQDGRTAIFVIRRIPFLAMNPPRLPNLVFD